MRLMISGWLMLLPFACTPPQRQSLQTAPRPDLRLTAAYQRTAANVRLDVVRPGYLLVIEQSPDGFVPVETVSSTELAQPHSYTFRVVRRFSLAAAPPPQDPRPPCTEFRSTEFAMQASWTGFCGLTPALAAVSRRSTSFSGFAATLDIHRVMALQFTEPVPVERVAAFFDALQWSAEPELIIEELRRRRFVPFAATWIDITPLKSEER